MSSVLSLLAKCNLNVNEKQSFNRFRVISPSGRCDLLYLRLLCRGEQIPTLLYFLVFP